MFFTRAGTIFRRLDVAACACVLFVALLVLMPMLRLGYLDDDLLMSITHGYLGTSHISVWAEISERVNAWIQGEGRFFPMPFVYSYVFFSFHPSMLVEKSAQLALVLLNVLTLFYACRRIGGTQIAGLVTLAFVVAVQVRSWFDPTISFFALLPLTAEAVLLSFLLWPIAIDRRSVAIAGVAFLCGLFALLSYELSYPIVACIGAGCLLITTSRRWHAIALAGTVGPVALLIVLDLVLRHVYPSHTYAITWDTGLFLRTFAEQFAAALPLSFAFITLHVDPVATFLGARPEMYVAALAGALIAYLLTAPARMPARRTVAILSILGCALWFFPAAIIALSHQLQIRTDHGFGNGYLNVYLESMGVGVLAGMILAASVSALGPNALLLRLGRVVLSVAVFVAIALGAQVDRTNMDSFLPIWTDIRSSVDRAFASAILTPLTPNAVVYWDSPYPVPARLLPALAYQDGRPAVPATFIDMPLFAPGRLCAFAKGASDCIVLQPTWILSANSFAKVMLTRVAGVHRDAGGALFLISDDWSIADPEPHAARFHEDATSEGSVLVVRGRDCLGTAIANTTDGLPPANIAFDRGFSAQESAQGAIWRWGSTHATLSLHRLLPARTPARATLSMFVQTLGAATVTIVSGRSTTRVDTTGAGTPVAVPVDLGTADHAEVRFTVQSTIVHVPGDPRELGIKISALAIDAACP